LLTETDSPFLSPIRNQRNEPCNVEYTINKIAEIKKMTRDEVEKIIFMNFQKVFLK
jgi:TatD DNase family protein